MELAAGECLMGGSHQPFDPRTVGILSARDAVRRWPALYLEGDGDRGLHKMLWYALDGLVAHYQAIQRDPERVDLRLDVDGAVTIQGRGSATNDVVSPDDVGLLEKELTVLGVDVPIGLFVVNALSSRLVVTRRCLKRQWVLEFKDGVLHSSSERIVDEPAQDAVIVTFWPDTTIVEGEFTYDLTVEVAHILATTYPTIAFDVVDVRAE